MEGAVTKTTTFGGVALFAVALSPILAQVAANAKLPPLTVAGTKIVDPNGKAVPLRGVNLGSWLVLEPHFSGFEFRDEKTLWATLDRRLGKAATERIREKYRAVWIGPKDFARVRDLGFNHVRVPYWWGMLEDDAAPGKFLDSGWKWLDAAVQWSEQAGLYCVLDLHGAPGGQSKADHTGEKDRNAVWTNPALQRRTAAIWSAVARRYKGSSAIAAFDLLNEPMDPPDNRILVSFQMELARAVRRVDPRRLVIVEEGYRGLDKLPTPTGRDRTGLTYSQHYYPTMGVNNPTPEVHERFLRETMPKIDREQTRFALPLYIGEWSVIQDSAGGGSMTRKHIDALDRRGWSWALWLYKQANKVPVRECWGFYRNAKPIAMPDIQRDSAERILDKLEQFRTENMVVYEPLRKAMKAE